MKNSCDGFFLQKVGSKVVIRSGGVTVMVNMDGATKDRPAKPTGFNYSGVNFAMFQGDRPPKSGD